MDARARPVAGGCARSHLDRHRSGVPGGRDAVVDVDRGHPQTRREPRPVRAGAHARRLLPAAARDLRRGRGARGRALCGAAAVEAGGDRRDLLRGPRLRPPHRAWSLAAPGGAHARAVLRLGRGDRGLLDRLLVVGLPVRPDRAGVRDRRAARLRTRPRGRTRRPARTAARGAGELAAPVAGGDADPDPARIGARPAGAPRAGRRGGAGADRGAHRAAARVLRAARALRRRLAAGAGSGPQHLSGVAGGEGIRAAGAPRGCWPTACARRASSR